MIPADHAATVHDEHELTSKAADALAALVALAERATELERERDEARRSREHERRLVDEWTAQAATERERAERAETALRDLHEWLRTSGVLLPVDLRARAVLGETA